MPTIEEQPDDGPKPVRARFVISETLMKDARGTVRTAVEALGVVASVTQNVPYLGTISSVLAVMLDIYNDVSAYKSDWKAVADMSQCMKAIVDEVYAKCETIEDQEEALPPAIAGPLSKLEQSLVKTIETLNVCMPASSSKASKSLTKRLKGFARDILNRGDLADSVKQCRADMQTTLDLFNTRLQIDQTLAIQTLLNQAANRNKQLTVIPQPSSIPASIILPPAPAIFHGRAQEVDHVLNLVLRHAPARVAILGPGGIGKTSIALTVLHHPEVEKRYADRRYFMSCEAAATAEAVVQELLKVFGVAHDSQSGSSPVNALLPHLRALPDGILCLDNLETPWDADIQAVEDVLSKIAALARLALLVTTRGTDRPKQVSWTRPFLPPVEPLMLDAALETWDMICESHDEYTIKLIEAVDCVPLAVNLLAHLAESESSGVLWTRWELEHAELLRARGPDHHLNSVDVSVQLSLQGPRLHDDLEAVQLLSVICTLPQGMPESRTAAFAEAYAALIPNLRRTIMLLKQCALVHSSSDGFLQVLSPVRSYIELNHPVSDPYFSCLANVYCGIVDFQSEDYASARSYAENNIQKEIMNIRAVLRLNLTRGNCLSERKLTSVNRFLKLCESISIKEVELVSVAITLAGSEFPSSVAELLRHKAISLGDEHRKFRSDILMMYEKALELYISLGDRKGEAQCLLNLGHMDAYAFRHDEAERFLQSALDTFEEIGDERGKIATLLCQSFVYDNLFHCEKAEYTLLIVIDLANKIGYDRGKAHAFRGLASVYDKQKCYAKEETNLRSALELYTQMGDRKNTARILARLGSLLDSLDRPIESESMLRTVLFMYREIGYSAGEINTLNEMGWVYRRLNQFDNARASLFRACELSKDLLYLAGTATAKYYLGFLYRDTASFDEAEACFEEATQLFEQAKQPHSARHSAKALYKLQSKRNASQTWNSLADVDSPAATSQAVPPPSSTMTIESRVS
ncbi:hypothetical protein PENSPDRAFT_686274 [Peniophora sp. CONT]|nr:hypothetical protein PENSPDRAFT_686274 [Peniophora sp. CONT]